MAGVCLNNDDTTPTTPRSNAPRTDAKAFIMLFKGSNSMRHLCALNLVCNHHNLRFLKAQRRIISYQHSCCFVCGCGARMTYYILVPGAGILLVSIKNRDLWPGSTPEVRDSRTSRHSAHAQSQV